MVSAIPQTCLIKLEFYSLTSIFRSPTGTSHTWVDIPPLFAQSATDVLLPPLSPQWQSVSTPCQVCTQHIFPGFRVSACPDAQASHPTVQKPTAY